MELALVWTTGRCLAHTQGWYENRREIQVFILIGDALVIALILLIVLIVFYRNIFGNILLTLGVLTALGLTMVKGINYHFLEQYYGSQIGPFSVADFIEFSGIALALIAVLTRLRQNRLEHG